MRRKREKKIRNEKKEREKEIRNEKKERKIKKER